MHNFSFLKEYRIYISFFVLFLIMFMFFPKEGKFKYEYQKGGPWMYETLVAPFDIPILKTQEELADEKESRASKVLPYFLYNENVEGNALKMLAEKAVSSNLSASGFDMLAASLRSIYEKGILPAPDGTYASGKGDMILLQKGKRAEQVLVGDLFTVEKAVSNLEYQLKNILSVQKADSLLASVNIKDYIIPNIIYDARTTELMHRRSADYISPTKGVLYAGQLIVSEGEIVTADIEQLLDSYKAEYEMSYGYSGNRLFLYLSHVILVFVVVGLIYLIILFYNPFLFKQYRSVCFLLSIPLFIFIISVIVRDVDYTLLRMVPYTVFALYMTAFFKSKFVYPIYMVSLLPLLIMVENGVELFFMNVAAGAVGVISFHYFGKGWHQFISAVCIFVSLALIYLSFRFLEEGSLSTLNFVDFIYYMCNAFFVVAAYPVVYLLEKIFGFLSSATLKDMADTNNQLLLELAQKAPGSFQHSLQVANLAEAAAREIDADSLLVRVGAMYHDIGKMQNPQCFIENQAAGVDYHAGLTPMESAQEIIRHVDDGVAIAAKYRLPEQIVDFIRTHHGRSQTLYFYNKFCNEGGDPSMTDEFTYNGTLPTKKEHVILMMADAVEAASRTLKDYSEKSISDLVDRILSLKISDSQLSMSEISLKEINMVKEVFKHYLRQIYHARIAYPERKKSLIRK